MTDLENEFGGQNIDINKTNPDIPDNSIEDKPNSLQNKLEDKIAEEAVKSASEKFSKTWIEKYFCCLDFLKKYFNINSKDFYRRLLNSLIPFNKKFHPLIENNPDLYGPFWIFTSLILVIAAAGSLAKLIQGSSSKNFFKEFIPIAAIIIYAVGFGLPIGISLLMKLFGSAINIMNVICTFGYSYSIYIPISIICSIPAQWLQWVLLLYGSVASTSLLVINYYKDVSAFNNNKKYLIIIIVVVVQLGVFLLFKLYFFKRFVEEVHDDDVKQDDNGKPGNSTILLF